MRVGVRAEGGKYPACKPALMLRLRTVVNAVLPVPLRLALATITLPAGSFVVELYRRFHLPFEILTNDKLEAARTGNWFVFC